MICLFQVGCQYRVGILTRLDMVAMDQLVEAGPMGE